MPIRLHGQACQYSGLEHTLLVLASDHGHTPVRWAEALGLEDLKLVFEELSENTGRAYSLEEPSLVNETVWSKVRALWGLVEEGHVSGQSNVVATLNGGTLGFTLNPRRTMESTARLCQRCHARSRTPALNLTYQRPGSGSRPVSYRHPLRGDSLQRYRAQCEAIASDGSGG